MDEHFQEPQRPTGEAATRRTYIRPRTGWQAIDWGEMWRSRDLLWMFTIRDIKVRYKQTFFGYAWALIVPIVQVLVISIFFGAALGVSDRVDAAAGRNLPYPLFALSGQIIWNFFRMSVDGGAASLMNNAGIIRKIYVPRLVLPISALGKPAMDTLVVFALLVGLVMWYAADAAYDVPLTPWLLLSPLILAGTMLPALGVGLISAAITVNYRDLQHVLPVAVQTLFYATPVIYSVESIALLPEQYRWLLYLNPVAGFIELNRSCILDLPVNWLGFSVSLGLSVVLVVFGLYYFARSERQFADVA